MRIVISPDGKRMAGLHNDGFDYDSLGPKEITRVSDVNFNNDTGEWDVYIRPRRGYLCVRSDGTFYFKANLSVGFKTRPEALAGEIKYMERNSDHIGHSVRKG